MQETIISAPFRKYDRYLETGVSWIGEIPSHWKLVRLGSHFFERRTKVSDKDYAPLSVTKNGIVPQLDDAAKTNDGDNRKLVRKGDFVINSRSDRRGSSGVSPLDGSVSLINIVLQPKNIDPTYCNYLLKCHSFIEEYYRVGRGIVADLWTTRYDEMRTIMLGLPPLPEQTAIADFLDRKTALIDKAIRIKERQIELLKERRQILIHRAVTRGLDPHVKLKDSGVEWIGEIPEHWEVRRLKYIATSRPSNVDKHSRDTEPEVLLCNYTDVYSNEFIRNELSFMKSTASKEQIEKFELRKGDIIITKDSETASDIAEPALVIEQLTNVVCGYHLAVIRPFPHMHSPYLFRCFQTKVFNIHFELHSQGITRVGLSSSDLKSGHFLVPPIDEQMAISHFIDTSNSVIDKSILAFNKQIENLKQYRHTLINSAVTGKIKVPGV